MRFDDLGIEILPKQFGSFPRHPKKHVNSHTKVRRQYNRQRVSRFFDCSALLLRMTSRADNERFTMLDCGAADFVGGIGMAEIDQHIQIFYLPASRIAEVALRDDLDFRIVLGEIANGFSHAPSCANE